MNTQDDSFLQSLLQYHSRLIDQEVVDKIVNKVRNKNKFRRWSLVISMALASLIALPMLSDLLVSFDLPASLSHSSPYVITLFVMAVMGLGVWFTSEDF